MFKGYVDNWLQRQASQRERQNAKQATERKTLAAPAPDNKSKKLVKYHMKTTRWKQTGKSTILADKGKSNNLSKDKPKVD